LTVADWVNIAGRFAANAHANTTTFARIVGWNIASILALIVDFLANANGRSAADWARIAGSLAINSSANTTRFARLVGWNVDSVVELATFFTANDHGMMVAQWIALTGRHGPNNANAVRELASWEGRGWPDFVTLAGVNYELRLVRDGIQFGNGYPHITLHFREATPVALYDWQRYPDYHVATAAVGTQKYDFVRDQDSFYGNVDRTVGGPIALARNLAALFWAQARLW